MDRWDCSSSSKFRVWIQQMLLWTEEKTSKLFDLNKYLTMLLRKKKKKGAYRRGRNGLITVVRHGTQRRCKAMTLLSSLQVSRLHRIIMGSENITRTNWPVFLTPPREKMALVTFCKREQKHRGPNTPDIETIWAFKAPLMQSRDQHIFRGIQTDTVLLSGPAASPGQTLGSWIPT